ncbi:unnamed protein product [Rangifer tarandus platyrhynchus]|uniref:Uncharacterized protein n=1 Tax=Rangifer tarandus platyrhynchus TaxID=3082113 RepID=A0AC59ZAQ0_RANTA
MVPHRQDLIGASVSSLLFRERPSVDSRVEGAVHVPSPPITSTVAAMSPLDRALDTPHAGSAAHNRLAEDCLPEPQGDRKEVLP